MKKKIFLFGILSLNIIHASNVFLKNYNEIQKKEPNFVISINLTKGNEIVNALLYKQFIYDLKIFDKMLQTLYNNKTYKIVSHTAELEEKNIKSAYTYDLIKMLRKLMEGLDSYNDFHILKNQGYIKYITDDFKDNYSFYLNGLKNKPIVENKYMNILYKRLQDYLQTLENHYKNKKDIREPLGKIYHIIITAGKDLLIEASKLKERNVLKPFDKEIDYKYKMPSNIAQYKCTIIDVLYYAIFGSKKYKMYGFKNYYYKIYYKKQNSKLIIHY